MQYKFFECVNYGNVFWNNDTENKPDRLYLNSLEFKEISTAFNYINQYIASINYPTDYYLSNKPNYFKVTDDTSNFVRFYFLKDISKENSETTTLTLELDIWSTYLLPSLVKNEDKPIELVRSHLKNLNNYQLDDPLLNSVPIIYDPILINKNYYNFGEVNAEEFVYKLLPEPPYAEREIYIQKSNIINANVYYCFKGLNIPNVVDDSYVFIPVITKSGTSRLRDGKQSGGEELITTINIPDTESIIDAQNQWEAVYAQYPNATAVWSTENIPVNTKPNELSFTVDRTEYCERQPYPYNNSRLVKTTVSNTIINNNVVYSYGSTFRSAYVSNVNCSGAIVNYPPPNSNISIKLYSKSGDIVYEDKTINNNKSYVESLVNKTQLANLFVGRFIMPNLMNFTTTIKSAEFLEPILVVEIPPDGVNVNNLQIADLDLSEWLPDKYNSTLINNKLIFKYYDIKYINAKLNNWNYYIYENGNINIGGLFLFSGSPAIISRNKYLSCSENIINLPYQLPSVSDEYIRYYSQSMSQINTGLKYAEINAAMGFTSGVFNSIMGGVGGFVGAGQASAAGKSPVSGIMSGISNIVNGGLGVANTAISLAQYRENVSSKWADVDRISGASYAASNIQDAATLTSYVTDDKFCEICEIKKPNSDTIKLLNNILFLYGNMTPMSTPIANITPRQKFNFIQVNQSWAATNLPTFLANENIDVINRCVAMLANGVRLWRVFPNYDVEN